MLHLAVDCGTPERPDYSNTTPVVSDGGNAGNTVYGDTWQITCESGYDFGRSSNNALQKTLYCRANGEWQDVNSIPLSQIKCESMLYIITLTIKTLTYPTVMCKD